MFYNCSVDVKYQAFSTGILYTAGQKEYKTLLLRP